MGSLTRAGSLTGVSIVSPTDSMIPENPESLKIRRKNKLLKIKLIILKYYFESKT